MRWCWDPVTLRIVLAKLARGEIGFKQLHELHIDFRLRVKYHMGVRKQIDTMENLEILTRNYKVTYKLELLLIR